MSTLKTIYNLARFEMTSIFRSWLFRIFSVLMIIAVTFLDMSLFVIPASSRWMFYGIPSSIPYFNMLFLNLVQGIIIILMVTDFLKKDESLDTTEVVYIKSLTNAQYVIGKTAAIFNMIMLLDLIVLLIAGVFNYFFVDVPVVFDAYILYPLLINVPTVIFIIGLTISTMLVLKNQAAAFIIVIGYCATTLFFLEDVMYNVFDYAAFTAPVLISDFVGAGDLHRIILQRSIYFFTGTGMIFLSVLLFKRLSQSRLTTILSFIVMAAAFTGALFSANNYFGIFEEGVELRKRMQEKSHQVLNLPLPEPVKYNIDLEHSGKEIIVKAGIILKNNSEENLDKYVLSLNPGMKISKISGKNSDLDFIREINLLTIIPERPLLPGETDSLSITYGGMINEDACYPGIDEQFRNQKYSMFLYNIEKRYGFITPEYVLLTGECNWYPVPPEIISTTEIVSSEQFYPEVLLNVKTAEGLLPISQGEVTKISDSEFSFRPETPVNGISLIIGNYKQLTLTVEEIDFNLYYLKGHDYFMKYLEAGIDDIPGRLESSIRRFENSLGLEYPYKRLSVIETPIQFYAYSHFTSIRSEAVQPEQILLPEKGVLLSSCDFKTQSYAIANRPQRGGMRREMTPEDISGMLFNSFISSTFLGSADMFQRMRGMIARTQGEDQLSFQDISLLAETDDSGNYSILPLYYSYSTHFSSDRWPLFNAVIESYLNRKIESSQGMRGRMMMMMEGLSDQDKANIALIEDPLSALLEDPTNPNAGNALEQKSTYLVYLMQSGTDSETFENFLTDYLTENRFSDIEVDEFLEVLKANFDLNLSEYFDAWLYEEEVPVYQVNDLECFEIIEENQTKYQILFTVSNLGNTSGIFEVSFRAGGRGFGRGRAGGGARGGGGMPGGRGGFFEPEFEKIYYLEAGETKSIGVLLNSRPLGMALNTLVSSNLPAVMNYNFQEVVKNLDLKSYEGEMIISNVDPLSSSEMVIVDNEDNGFRINEQVKKGFLNRIFGDSEENSTRYVGLNIFDPPGKWQAAVSDNYFGNIRKSAHYIKSGSGENKVSWTAEIPKNGTYDVLYYVSPVMGRRGMGRGRGGQSGGGGDRQRESLISDFHFVIHHDDGSREVTMEIDKFEPGWNMMGSFYFSKGDARVELTDESGGRIVYADAVKWQIVK